MSTRMKVNFEVTTQEEIKAVMAALNIDREIREVKIVENAEPKKTEVSISQDLKKRSDIAAIKSAYYAAKEKEKTERVSKQIAEAQERMDPEETKPKKSSGRNPGRRKKDLPMDEVIRLHEEEKMTFNELGERFGCSGWTVRMKYHEAKGE